MEKQMLENIRKFEIKQGLSMNGFNPASVRTVTNRENHVFWLDKGSNQIPQPNTAHSLPRRPIHGINNIDPISDYQVKQDSRSPHNKKVIQSVSNWKTSNHAFGSRTVNTRFGTQGNSK